MSIHCPLLLSFSKLLLIILAFILQLIALCTSWWASFSARTDLGKPSENGHYGLWTLCSTKGPHWMEDCDPLDTFFSLPPYSKVSGVVGVLHLILLLSLIPLASIRILQIVKNMVNFGFKTKAIRITEVVLSSLSVIFALLVAVFVSVGEDQKEYSLHKGWSFWMQISVIVIDIAVTTICVFEGVRLYWLFLQQQIDPTGKRAETYGNPSFDNESPEMPRSNNGAIDSTNGAIAFTESSGHPYNPQPIAGPKKSKGIDLTKSRNSRDTGKNSVQTLTYENECYQESSPTMERTRTRRN